MFYGDSDMPSSPSTRAPRTRDYLRRLATDPRETSGFIPCFHKISSFCLIGSASVAAAAAVKADTLSIALFAAALATNWFIDTARLRTLLPARFIAFTSIVYLCFAPVDHFLLSSGWPRVLLHAIWFALAIKLITQSGDKDWPPLYFIGSVQWILAAAQPTGTIFGVSFAVFIISGISALMFSELRRPLKITDLKENPGCVGVTVPTVFPTRAFLAAVTGITAAVTTLSIPLFFFFPRLPVKSGEPLSPDTVSPFDDLIEDVETIELGREYDIQKSDAIVMRVKTDVPEENLPFNLKWRGTAFDHYDGRSWTLSRREQLPVATQGGFYKLEESAMGSELLRQTFFMEDTLNNNKIYAMHRALAVSTDAGFLRRDSSDNLNAYNPAQRKNGYIVVSDPIYPDADRISDWTPIPNDIYSTWLQLPEPDPRVAQLALEITGGYNRQYDKARALEIWLRSRYGYTALPPISKVTESGDPLAVFLFDSREGHCEYFATAMTVMLRYIGIPARMVSGFLAGEYNRIGDSWTVRRKHSHTWTEAWFSPYGWVEFDATPMDEIFEKPTIARFFADVTDTAGLWWRQNVAGYDATRQYSVVSGFITRVNRAEDRAGTFLSSSANSMRDVFNLFPQTADSVKIAALSVLFIAVFRIFVLRRLRRRFPRKYIFMRRKQNHQAIAVDFYSEALLFLNARGLIPEKAQTPMEFAQSLAGSPRVFHGDSAAAIALIDLTRFYNEARFGKPTAPFPCDEARALLHKLKVAFEPLYEGSGVGR